MSGLKQINISYNKVEDRLLLQITNLEDEEIRLWLTYHFTSKILEALNHNLSKRNAARFGEETARQVLQADKAVAAEKAVTHTAFQEAQSDHFPLGVSGMLVTSINIKPEKESYSITFGDADDRTVTIKLPKELLLTVLDSIEKKAAEAEWFFKSGATTQLPTTQVSLTHH